jgi:hypothetical protein
MLSASKKMDIAAMVIFSLMISAAANGLCACSQLDAARNQARPQAYVVPSYRPHPTRSNPTQGKSGPRGENLTNQQR